MQTIFKEYGRCPFLLIVNESELESWTTLLNEKAPELSVLCYAGNQHSRDILRDHCLFAQKDLPEKGLQAHVLLTTFDIFLSDTCVFQAVGRFEAVINSASLYAENRDDILRALKVPIQTCFKLYSGVSILLMWFSKKKKLIQTRVTWKRARFFS